ncbi:MAG: cysteine desulfurase ATPase component [bacterium ADurb.Bin212]|nr:MAG: cysteine desulfurase ATPase component [bacterium ADurb.Bin212]
MQDIVVELECEMGNSFRCQKAADSVNLDPSTKSKHILNITIDELQDFNIGVILGASGSGKTTLARKIFGNSFEENVLDLDTPIIDQFKKDVTYEECVNNLTGMGLTSIPCWLRPVKTLSNGQKARAEAALKLSLSKENVTVIDEWTSVVDRTVAKVMSHTIQKEVRKNKKKIVLLSCHYDVVDWLNPDFIIDCNKSTYVNRKKSGEVESHKRQDSLRLEVRPCDKSTWKYFSKYHYLSHNIAPDTRYTFGLFDGENQIGFCAFTRYAFKNSKMLHSNRVVIHPDYVGLGLGIKLVDISSEYLSNKGYEIRAKFTSVAMLKARMKNKKWQLLSVQDVTSNKMGAVGKYIKVGGIVNDEAKTKKRNDAKLFYVKYFIFRFLSEKTRRV